LNFPYTSSPFDWCRSSNYTLDNALCTQLHFSTFKKILLLTLLQFLFIIWQNRLFLSRFLWNFQLCSLNKTDKIVSIVDFGVKYMGDENCLMCPLWKVQMSSNSPNHFRIKPTTHKKNKTRICYNFFRSLYSRLSIVVRKKEPFQHRCVSGAICPIMCGNSNPKSSKTKRWQFHEAIKLFSIQFNCTCI
jgi:hypothetical protein